MFSAKNIAVACQLHQHMPGLVNCAYAMTMDYEVDPKSFPEAKREYERLKNLLSRECRARKRLEYEYKDSRKKVREAKRIAFLISNSKDGTVYPPLNETKPNKQVQQDSETQSQTQGQEQSQVHRIKMR